MIIDKADTTAVSVRRRRFPKETNIALLSFNREISLSVKSPSGPTTRLSPFKFFGKRECNLPIWSVELHEHTTKGPS